MMISFEHEEGRHRFHMRAASVVIHRQRVLLQRLIHEDVWFIPGGRVEFFETAEQTVEREMLEEFGVFVTDKKLLWTVENLSENTAGRKLHEIGFFYRVELQREHPIYEHEDEFKGLEPLFSNKWVPLDQLDMHHMVPSFVGPALKQLGKTEGVLHIVNREVRIAKP